jgi:D-beta-D-heptose 7-phosphate kinase/D-beta-D-heptose 1-phosphate adenosyltransferase
MLKVLVVGDSCLDVFKYGTVKRICPEAPCAVFETIEKTENEGMAANVVANLKALDSELEITFVTNIQKPYKIRYVETKSNQMLLREDLNDHIAQRFRMDGIDFSSFSAVIVSDYNKGFLTEEHLRAIAGASKLSFLDTKKPLDTFAIGYSFIKINELEWEEACKRGVKANDWGTKLLVTKGANGCDWNGSNYPTTPIEIANIAGAGDSFLAALVVEYLKSKNIPKAIHYANEITSIVVTKKGVTTV